MLEYGRYRRCLTRCHLHGRVRLTEPRFAIVQRLSETTAWRRLGLRSERVIEKLHEKNIVFQPV